MTRRTTIDRDHLTDAVTPDAIVQLEGVQKVYRMGKTDSPALRGVDLVVAAGSMVAVMGPSGSGKSTLLNLIAGIDSPTAGTVIVNGTRLNDLSEEELAVWRGDNVGIVFQFFQLLPTLTALENAVLPLELTRWRPARQRARRARHHLDLVGLVDKSNRLPLELSGGEQQRVAVARAIACEPRILLADEPTGNLDTVAAREMFRLLGELHAEGSTVVYVTHDPAFAALAERVVTVRDGRIVEDTGRDT